MTKRSGIVNTCLIYFLCHVILPVALFQTNLFAQENTAIPLSNTSPGGIGHIDSGNEIWHPIFFDMDTGGNIHIPDFYKNRIAVFDRNGELAAEYPAGPCLSPRMNYFGLLDRNDSDPLWICWNDSTLYVVSKNSVVLEKSFNPGTIPERIIPSGELLFVVLKGSQSSLIFGPFSPRNTAGQRPRASPDPVGSYTRDNKPLIRVGAYNLPLALDAFLSANPGITVSFENTRDHQYLGALTGKNPAFFWITHTSGTSGGAEQVCIIYPDTRQAECRIIRFPADSFWTILSSNGIIYRNCRENESLVINRYGE